MTPSEAIAQARANRLLPVYLVAGEERLVRDQVVAELRKAALGSGVAAFNEDKFTAGEADVDAIVAAARTVPMMAPRRYVLVRGVDRWDSAESSAPFDRLAEYAGAPVPSTCMVIVGAKVDGRRKLMQIARKEGFFVPCDPLDARALPMWIVDRCTSKGHPIERDVAELLAALSGPDLSSVDDAIERLSLYVGAQNAIDEAAIGACVARVRTADTWALVDAVGARTSRVRCARSPTRTTRASAGCRCSGRWRGRSARWRATRRRSPAGPRPTTPRGRPEFSSPIVRGSSAPRRRRCERRRSSSGCWSSPRPTWH